MIIASRHVYSVYDLITGKRLLYKYFNDNDDSSKRFNVDNRFDVFRILMQYAVNLLAETEVNPKINNILTRFVAFVKQPIRPNILQRVGGGISYDVVKDGKHFVYVKDKLRAYGYEAYFDLRECYELGVIIVHPATRAILIPGSETMDDFGYVCGINLDGQVLIDKGNEFWAVPKLIFAASQSITNVFPFFGKCTK